MTCHRCNGLMIREQFNEVMSVAGETEFTGWRCLNCAAVFDPVIEANRRRMEEAAASARRPVRRSDLVSA